MIEGKYRGVTLDVHHNNSQNGFSAQATMVNNKKKGGELVKLVIRK